MQFRLSHNQVEHNFGCYRVNWNALFAGGVNWNACNLRCCAGRRLATSSQEPRNPVSIRPKTPIHSGSQQKSTADSRSEEAALLHRGGQSKIKLEHYIYSVHACWLEKLSLQHSGKHKWKMRKASAL